MDNTIKQILEKLEENKTAALKNFQKYSEYEDFGKWLAYNNAIGVVKVCCKEDYDSEAACVDIINRLHNAIKQFTERMGMRPTHVILSRNYVDIIKKEYESYDMYVTDEELTFDGLPIKIDEMSVNYICTALIVSDKE